MSLYLGVFKVCLCKFWLEFLNLLKVVGSGLGEGFDVVKYGYGCVVLIGFLFVGKLMLLS